MLQCVVCGKLFKSESTLNVHIKHSLVCAHFVDVTIRCRYCARLLSDFTEVEAHVTICDRRKILDPEYLLEIERMRSSLYRQMLEGILGHSLPEIIREERDPELTFYLDRELPEVVVIGGGKGVQKAVQKKREDPSQDSESKKESATRPSTKGRKKKIGKKEEKKEVTKKKPTETVRSRSPSPSPQELSPLLKEIETVGNKLSQGEKESDQGESYAYILGTLLGDWIQEIWGKLPEDELLHQLHSIEPEWGRLVPVHFQAINDGLSDRTLGAEAEANYLRFHLRLIPNHEHGFETQEIGEALALGAKRRKKQPFTIVQLIRKYTAGYTLFPLAFYVRDWLQGRIVFYPPEGKHGYFLQDGDKWILDPYLNRFTNQLANQILDQCQEVYRYLYHLVYHDYTYRKLVSGGLLRHNGEAILESARIASCPFDLGETLRELIKLHSTSREVITSERYVAHTRQDDEYSLMVARVAGGLAPCLMPNIDYFDLIFEGVEDPTLRDEIENRYIENILTKYRSKYPKIDSRLRRRIDEEKKSERREKKR